MDVLPRVNYSVTEVVNSVKGYKVINARGVTDSNKRLCSTWAASVSWVSSGILPWID